MKKYIWVPLLALALLPASALARDIEPGTIEISGTTNLNLNWSSEEQGQDTDTYTLNAEGQYYFVKNLALGAFLSYEDVNIGNADSTLWLLGPQLTYNLSYDEKVNFFGTVGIGYADYDLGTLSGDGFLIRFGGGVKYFVTKSIALVGQIRYQWINLDQNELSEININGGLSVFF